MKFKIGDNVIVSDTISYPTRLIGKKGTVIEIYNNIPQIVGVEFNENIFGHSCGGKGKDGCCYRMVGRELKKLETFSNWKEEMEKE